MPAASLQALLAYSIDYAGMFPPCSLALESALQNHANYVRSPEAWMLNTFVLPVEQFDAARNSFRLSIPYIRCVLRRLDRKPRMRKPFLKRSRKPIRRFVRCPAMSISYRLVTLRCFYRAM